jgi:hypothetical protein
MASMDRSILVLMAKAGLMMQGGVDFPFLDLTLEDPAALSKHPPQAPEFLREYQ